MIVTLIVIANIAEISLLEEKGIVAEKGWKIAIKETVETRIGPETGQEVSEDLVVHLGVVWTEIVMIDIEDQNLHPEVKEIKIVMEGITIGIGTRMVKEIETTSIRTLCQKGLKSSAQRARVKRILKTLILKKKKTRKLLLNEEGNKGKNF